jgi:hypothetical protein
VRQVVLGMLGMVRTVVPGQIVIGLARLKRLLRVGFFLDLRSIILLRHAEILSAAKANKT